MEQYEEEDSREVRKAEGENVVDVVQMIGLLRNQIVNATAESDETEKEYEENPHTLEPRKASTNERHEPTFSCLDAVCQLKRKGGHPPLGSISHSLLQIQDFSRRCRRCHWNQDRIPLFWEVELGCR